MMQLEIKQQYMTVGNHFDIADGNGQTRFYASEEFFTLFTRKCDLLDLTNNPIYRLRMRFTRIFGRYDIERNDAQIGEFKGKFHFFKTRRVELTTDCGKFYIYADILRLSVRKVDENGKREKGDPVCVIKKEAINLVDTYNANFDETQIPPHVVALIGIWFDMTLHGKRH